MTFILLTALAVSVASLIIAIINYRRIDMTETTQAEGLTAKEIDGLISRHPDRSVTSWTSREREVITSAIRAALAAQVEHFKAYRIALERIADPRDKHFGDDARTVAAKALSSSPASTEAKGEPMLNGLTKAETEVTASVLGLTPAPAGAKEEPDIRTPDQMPTIRSSLTHGISLIGEILSYHGDDIGPSLSEQCRIFLELSDEALAAPAEAKEDGNDWQHLKQFGYAPGNYMSRCRRCGQTPIMDKRAVTCRPCAEFLHAAATPQPQAAQPVAWADKIAFESAMAAGKGCDVWPKPGDYESRTGRDLVALYTAAPALTEEQKRMETTLKHIASLAHEGGLANLNEHGSLTHIRRLSLPYWKDSGTQADSAARVNAAVSAALRSTQGGE